MLVARQPDNFALKRNYQVALRSVGGAYEDRGDLDMAAEYYRVQREVASASAAVDPRNATGAETSPAAESTFAGALRLMGSLREAERAYERALAIIRPIAEASPCRGDAPT